VAFFPKVSLTLDPALDPANPFSVPFIVSNDTVFFGLFDMKGVCYVNRVEYARNSVVREIPLHIPHFGKTLDSGGKGAFRCPFDEFFHMGEDPVSADISVRVSIASVSWPFGWTYSFRYGGRRGSGGEWRWLAMGTS